MPVITSSINRARRDRHTVVVLSTAKLRRIANNAKFFERKNNQVLLFNFPGYGANVNVIDPLVVDTLKSPCVITSMPMSIS